MARVPPCILYILGCRKSGRVPEDKKNGPKHKKKWRALRLVIYTFCGVENQAEYRKTKTMAPKVKTQKLAGVPLWPARAQSRAHPSEPDNNKKC